MADSPKKPPANGPKGRDPRKERNQSGNGMWYLLVFGVIGILIFSTMSQGRNGTEVSLSDFKRQVVGGTLHSRNVP